MLDDIFHVNSDMNDTFHIIFDKIIYSTIIFKNEKKEGKKVAHHHFLRLTGKYAR